MDASRSPLFDPTELNSYPCTSPHFDPTITSSARIRDILGRCFDFGTRDELICIDIDGGVAGMW